MYLAPQCFKCYIVLYIGEGNGTPLQYSCLENPTDRGPWWAAVHGVAKSRTRLSDFTLTFHFPALEKEMATHSSVFAWRVPGTGEPGGLPSTGSQSQTRLKRLSSSSSSSAIYSTIIFLILKYLVLVNSLVVWWLGLLCFYCRWPWLISGRGTKTPQAVWHSQNKIKIKYLALTR